MFSVQSYFLFCVDVSSEAFFLHMVLSNNFLGRSTWLIDRILIAIAQLAGAVEYTDCVYAEV